MPENTIRLEGPDIEELCDIILDGIREYADPWVEIRSMKVRFNVNHDFSDGFSEPTFRRGIQEIIYPIMNENGNFYDFLSHAVNRYSMYVEKFDRILRKYGFNIVDNGGQNIIVPLYGETFQQEIEHLQGYIENNAPQKTFEHLKEAKEKFTNGDYDGCLSECRMALESLTKNGSFSDGMHELVSLGLITDNNNQLRKDDGWLLKSIYGYNSTMGSHSTSGSQSTSSEQAFMGLIITQSTIRFLLKKIEEIRQRSMQSNEWKI